MSGWPKIIGEDAFKYMLKGPYDETLWASIHDSPSNVGEKYEVYHLPWQVCTCNFAEDMRKERKRVMSDEMQVPANAVTFEEWKEGYNDPEKLIMKYNELFCGETKPIVEMSAEELMDRRHLLENLMTHIKIQYKKTLDMESTRMEELDELERARIRKLDMDKRFAPRAENERKIKKMTAEEKMHQKAAKTLGVDASKAKEIFADLAGDVADLMD